jgi:hypothetical protein
MYFLTFLSRDQEQKWHEYIEGRGEKKKEGEDPCHLPPRFKFKYLRIYSYFIFIEIKRLIRIWK